MSSRCYGPGEGVGMNIVIVSVLLSIAIIIPIGFVFGGLLWGLLLIEFISLLILAGLYVAEEKSAKAAILREQIAAQCRTGTRVR